MSERLSSAITLAAIGAVIWIVGLLAARWIGRDSPRRRLHGRYVLCWMIVGWTIGAIIGIRMLDRHDHLPGEADIGCAGFGMLAGLVLGMLHGGMAVWRQQREAV